jgi:hypothetical protein
VPVILVSWQMLQSMVEPYHREASVFAMILDYGLHRTPS